MFHLFSNKKSLFISQDVKVDMHSHLLPGIDDGSKTMEDTLQMLRKFSQLGYKKVITTPHIYWDYYKNTPEIINEKLAEVRAAILESKLEIEIEAAAEYYFDSYFLEQIEKENLLTFGDNYVLFELPFQVKPNNVDQLIFLLLARGYKPVLAHYERYVYYHSEKLAYVKDFKRRGVFIQMNLLSLTGHYGSVIKKQAEIMIDQNMVDFIATDCHRIEHLNLLQKQLNKKYFKRLKDLPLKNKELL